MAQKSAKVFSDRYEIVRRIARGGMAEVFLARDLLLDRPVALKILFPELSTDRNFVERFRREAQAAANLSHPNIVSIYDWGEEDGTYFIVMEFVDGRPLSQLIRYRGPTGTGPGGRHRLGGGGRAGLRPPQRRDPPRREAGQRAARRGRQREGHRLRDRPGHQRPGQPHPDRNRDGDGHLLQPRTGAGVRRRQPQRRVLARRRALRDGHRPAAVQRREPGVGRVPPRERSAQPASQDQRQRARRVRVGGTPGAGQEPRRPLRHRRGSAQ